MPKPWWIRALCIPEHVAMQLQLRTLETREVIRADGKPHSPNIPMSVATGSQSKQTSCRHRNSSI